MEKIDERYKRGKIYTIRCRNDDTLIYVGSTIQKLSRRIALHRQDKTCSLNQKVDGDWDNWYIELYEEYPCNNIEELNKREGEVIREVATINKKISGRSKKEYYNENKDVLKEKNKIYREINKDYILERAKEYQDLNKDKIQERNKIKCECPLCGMLVRKYDLKRHQTRNICLKNKIFS